MAALSPSETTTSSRSSPRPPVASLAGARPGSPSLRRNAFWIISGNSIYAATQWLQIAVIAHIGTSVDVGHYAFAIGICAPVFMFFNLQLRTVQATDASGQYSFGEYLAVRVATSIAALLTIAIVSCLLMGSMRLGILIAAVGLFKGIESISDIYQGLLQQSEMMDLLARSFIFKGCLVIVAFSLTYVCVHDLFWSVVAMSLAQATSLVLYDVPSCYRAVHGSRPHCFADISVLTKAQWRSSSLKALALRALPLGITMMLISLYANLPRFVLERYEGPAGLGIFAAVTYLSNIGAMLVSAIGTSVCPRLSRLAQRDHVAFRSLLTKLVFLAAAVGIGGIAASIAFGRQLLQMMYGAEYAAQNRVFILTMIAAAVGYVTSMLGYGATALGRFREQPWALLLAAVVVLGASVVFVPRYHLLGGAMASLSASLASLCAFLVIVNRKKHAKF